MWTKRMYNNVHISIIDIEKIKIANPSLLDI